MQRRSSYIRRLAVLGTAATVTMIVVPALTGSTAQAATASSPPGGATAVENLGHYQPGPNAEPDLVDLASLPPASPETINQPAPTHRHQWAAQDTSMVPRVPKPTLLPPPGKDPIGPNVAPSLFFQNDADGLDNNASASHPPDPAGIAGNNHYVQTVNSSMAVYNKSNLARISVTNLQTFFGANVFDPHVTLDYDSRRYALVATDGTNIRVAVSRTTDPTGAWCRYTLGGLNADNPGGLADFPLISLNGALFISLTEFDNANPRHFTGNRMIIVNRDDVENCVSARIGFFANLTFAGGTDRVGPIAPLTDTVGLNSVPVHTDWIASHGGGGSDVTFFDYDQSNGSLVSFRLPTQNYAAPPDARQQGSGTRIEAGDSRVFQFTNALVDGGFGWDTFALATSCTFPGSTVQAGCIEWFRICSHCPGGPTINAQGIFGFGADWHAYYPSVAIDTHLNLAFNFALSGVNYFVSAASLALNSSNEFSSTNVQGFGTHTYNVLDPGEQTARWGDFTSMFMDPAGQNPGRTFWLDSETTIANDRWGTHISGVQTVGG